MKIRINLMTLISLLVLSVANFPDIVRSIIYAIIFACVILLFLLNVQSSGGRFSAKRKSIERAFWISIPVVFILAIFNFIINGISSDSFERLIQLLLCFLLLYVSAQYTWTEEDIWFLKIVIRFWVFIYMISWATSGFSSRVFKAGLMHSNGLGAILFSYMFICLFPQVKKRLLDYIVIAAIALLIFLSTSRSVWLAIIACVGLSIYIKCLGNKKYKHIFELILILALAVPFTYMLLYTTDIGMKLNEISINLFGKNLFSGRQVFWGSLLELIFQHPIRGYGFAASPETLMGISLSSHNWYMQIVLQMGIFGLIILLANLKFIWNILYSNREHAEIRLIAVYLIGVMVWQCFEVSLTQNNLQVGLIVWLILGIGISASRAREEGTALSEQINENYI